MGIPKIIWDNVYPPPSPFIKSCIYRVGIKKTSMKKINLTKLKKELTDLKADNSTFELIVNNVYLYNDLVAKYTAGNIGRDIYLMYQVNSQIIKQIADLKKIQNKMGESSSTDPIDLLI